MNRPGSNPGVFLMPLQCTYNVQAWLKALKILHRLMVRDQKAAGSNPATSTEKLRKIKASGVFFIFRYLLLPLATMYITMYTTMYSTMYKIKNGLRKTGGLFILHRWSPGGNRNPLTDNISSCWHQNDRSVRPCLYRCLWHFSEGLRKYAGRNMGPGPRFPASPWAD